MVFEVMYEVMYEVKVMYSTGATISTLLIFIIM